MSSRVELVGEAGLSRAASLEWGMEVRAVYRLGLAFYRTAMASRHFGYDDRLRLIAYTQQVAHGPCSEATAPPLGVLDVIGRDRRATWLQLKDMSQTNAMLAFVHALDKLCPAFRPYVEAHKIAKEEQVEEKKEIDEMQKKAEMEQHRLQQQKNAEEEQIKRIKDALNEQTYEQFLQYARQQYPGNPDQQAVLVRQLQDQHYHQYVQQLALNKQAAAATDQRSISKGTNTECSEKDVDKTIDVNLSMNENLSSHISIVTEKQSETNEDSSPEHIDDSQSDDGDGFPTIASPSMWTRSGTAQFKQTVRSAIGGGGVLQVGHGETVTIRVPTHVQGRCLFWEFATDNFDIGFGVYFEWLKSPTSQVTVHVAESDDDGDLDAENFDDEDEEIIERCNEDAESGTGLNQSTNASSLKPPLSIIIPIYRRDSHLEVYAGSHAYPGEGVYLLKFDNTFSLWRSKTLYYRVYYTR